MKMVEYNSRTLEVIDILYMSHGWTIEMIAKAMRMPKKRVNEWLVLIGYDTRY